MVTSTQACPCGSGRAYARCCGPLHQGAPAPDPASLMRSRYSAYVLGLHAYLRDTWHPSTRPDRIDDHDQAATKWLALEVRRVEPPVARSDGRREAWVEFVARYRVQGRGGRLHERSRFLDEQGRWFYVDGEIR